MSDARLRVGDLKPNAPHSFDVTPDAAFREQLTAKLSLLSLTRLRFVGELMPMGTRDWLLKGRLYADITQPCVVTLDPVRTRIDEPVERQYTPEPPVIADAGEAEMPEDDRIEALGSEIDLMQVLEEALLLAIPAYPRRPDAELERHLFTEPGKSPMTDADAHPFAGLKDLRAKRDDDAP